MVCAHTKHTKINKHFHMKHGKSTCTLDHVHTCVRAHTHTHTHTHFWSMQKYKLMVKICIKSLYTWHRKWYKTINFQAINKISQVNVNKVVVHLSLPEENIDFESSKYTKQPQNAKPQHTTKTDEGVYAAWSPHHCCVTVLYSTILELLVDFSLLQ